MTSSQSNISGKNVTWVISHVHSSLAMEWAISHLAGKCRISVVLLNPSGSPFESALIEQGVSVRRITYRSKADLPLAFLRTLLFFIRSRPDIVHAHLLDAQLIGLGAAWLSGIHHRIYTRHTSTFHHVYHPKGVRYDKISNRFATTIISVSDATDHALVGLENVDPSKLVRIPHGFDFRSFADVSMDRVRSVRSKWSLSSAKPVVGVVSRLIEWKGVEYIVRAFAEFQRKYPMASLVIANASGPQESVIRDLIGDLSIQHVNLIPFEDDAPALYHSFDLMVHAPVDPWCEAFGQVYVEAMASGVPMIVTRSGVAAQYVVDRENALVVPFREARPIADALEMLWKNEEMRVSLAVNARTAVVSRFGIDTMIAALIRVYNA